MTSDTITHSTPSHQGRISDKDALHAVRLAEDFPDLEAHNPDAIRVAGESIRAMQTVANGDTPSIRCDQKVRYRQLQLDASKRLPYVEVVAIAMENMVGRAVFVEGVRVVLNRIGYDVIAREQQAATLTLQDALMELTEAAADLEPTAARDVKALRVVEAVRRVIGPRVAFHRRSRG